MNKDWLVRTGQNKILGPISREKLLELVEKGSLSDTDEICRGNGYWFYLREEELVEKYLFENVKQPFNPISECKTVLCRKSSDVEEEDHADVDNTLVVGQDILGQLKEQAPEVDELSDSPVLPDGDDLEFPDEIAAAPKLDAFESDDSFDESTLPSVADLQLLDDEPSEEVLPPVESKPEPEVGEAEEQFEGKLPSDDDLEYPDLGDDISLDSTGEIEIPAELDSLPDEAPSELPEQAPVKPVPPKKLPRKMVQNDDPKAPTRKPSRKEQSLTSKSGGSDRYLFIIFFIMVALVAYTVYFYYAKIANFRSDKGYLEELGALIVPSAHAQSVAEVAKKKRF